MSTVPPLRIEDELVTRVARHLVTKRLVPLEQRPDPASLAASSGASAERLLRDQPEALAFVLAGTSQLSPQARAAGVLLTEVIFDVFRLAGRSTRPVRPSEFVDALRGNRDMALRVGRAHDRIAERYLRNSNTLRQPALIRYVTGVLLEPGAQFPHTLAREELGPLFIVLKSIIDVLDADAIAERIDGAARSSEPA